MPYYADFNENDPYFIEQEYFRPNKIYFFSSDQKVSVGGYLLQKSEDFIKISEFMIYDLGKNEEVKFFGALQTCIITQKKDTLFIRELARLPFGENQAWIEVPYLESKLYPQNNSFIITSAKKALKAPSLSPIVENKLLYDIEKYKGGGRFPKSEDTIGILLLLALNNNNKAKFILLNYETYFGFRVDGSEAEFYQDVLNILKMR